MARTHIPSPASGLLRREQDCCTQHVGLIAYSLEVTRAVRPRRVRNFRHTVRHSNHRCARAARYVVRRIRRATLPVPRPIVLPLVGAFVAFRTILNEVLRVLICEPFFKAQCASYGTDVHTGSFMHFILGSGDIIVGSRALLEGKSSFIFGSILPDRPVLEIGHGTYVNHGCTFIVARRVTIGNDVMLAGSVTVFDSPGHPLDAEKRIAKLPPCADEIKPVVICDKVWIATGAYIFPGVTVGEGAVVGMGALVTKDVAPYTLVAGVPARFIRDIREQTTALTASADVHLATGG